MHAKTVSLVLNISTGLVSPQFHIKFDDFFETVNLPDDNLKIEWKEKCHFVKTSPQFTGNMPTSEGVLTTPNIEDPTKSKIVTSSPEDPITQTPSVLQHEEGDDSVTNVLNTTNTEEINVSEQETQTISSITGKF
jgi:hypothetical protein